VLGRLPTLLRPLVRHVVTENERVLTVAAALRAGEPDRIGPALTASHTSLRDDYRVSCPELDLVVEAALDAGALGARMTGAGFGGSVITLLRAGTAPAVEEAVVTAFARHGFAEPGRFVAQPSAGAGRDQQAAGKGVG
jgi:galactokinase